MKYVQPNIQTETRGRHMHLKLRQCTIIIQCVYTIKLSFHVSTLHVNLYLNHFMIIGLIYVKLFLIFGSLCCIDRSVGVWLLRMLHRDACWKGAHTGTQNPFNCWTQIWHTGAHKIFSILLTNQQNEIPDTF